jgi:two-component system, sensor histidine kinase PdtaS
MRLNKRYFLLKKLIGILILLINTTFGQNAKNAERLAYCDSLEKVALTQGKPALTAKAYYIRGKIASEQFDINRSNEWFFKALEIHKNLAISEDLGKVYGYLATNAGISSNKKDFEYFLNKAEKVYQQTNSKDGLRDVHGKKSNFFIGQFDQNTNYQKAIEMWKSLIPKMPPLTFNDSMHIASVNFQLGWLYLQLSDKACLEHLSVTENIWKSTKSEQLMRCFLIQADAYIKFKMIKQLEDKIKEIETLNALSSLDSETRLHYYQTMASYAAVKRNIVKHLENALAAEKLTSYKNEKSKVDFSVFHSNSEKIIEQDETIAKRDIYIIVSFFSILLLFFLFIWAYKNYQSKAKEEFKSSLMVQEVNHRVKNNFQTLSNLLILQDEELTDSKSKKALEETQSRINSLAIVHSHLYGNKYLENIEMEDFLFELTTQILKAYNLEGIEFNLKVQAPLLSADKAILLGLITNEWLTNICKYTFKDKSKERLEVNLYEADSIWKLRIEDFGNVPIKESRKSSFGLPLITKLVKQLDGKMKFNEFKNLSEIIFTHSQE